MSGSLRWEVAGGAEGLALSLSGALDERADLDALCELIPAGRPVELGLARVERVSSAGVQAWIAFLGKLKERGVEVTLVECSPCIVRQLGMSAQLRGHAGLRSVNAPYYCVRCNEEQLRTIELGADVLAQIRAAFECPGCGAALRLDDEEVLYTQLGQR